MTINDEIITIANQIANQGKKPSVALIKTKLTSPVPLPTIISVLKSWSHDPDFTSVQIIQSIEPKSAEDKNDGIESLIQAAVAPLYKGIAALKQTVNLLSEKLK